MSSIDKRCSLCFEKQKYKDLIYKDGLQLCDKCNTMYEASGYNQKVMLIRAIQGYRLLVKRYEDISGTKIDTDFKGVRGNDETNMHDE